MNFDRIASSIDVSRTQGSHVVVIGGATHLASDLARCGVVELTLADFGKIDETNPARQDLPLALGQLKVEAAREFIRTINPDATVHTLVRDVCSLNDEEIDDHFGRAALIIAATDSLPAQARCNQIALHLGVPFMAIGLYAAGRAGEIIWHLPGSPCYRCITASRYRAFAGGSAQVTSEGGTILDLRLVDAVAAHVAVGILTRGADNRLGRLLGHLGGRNLLIVRTDPEFTLGDPDRLKGALGGDPSAAPFPVVGFRVKTDPRCPDCARARREP